jgi:RNA polymerase sigma-70 factor (ECF subfamily)
MQILPPRQRAALIVPDVLGWSANETTSLLETSVAAANSTLQRARGTMQAHLPPRRTEWSAATPSAEITTFGPALFPAFGLPEIL